MGKYKVSYFFLGFCMVFPHYRAKLWRGLGWKRALPSHLSRHAQGPATASVQHVLSRSYCAGIIIDRLSTGEESPASAARVGARRLMVYTTAIGVRYIPVWSSKGGRVMIPCGLQRGAGSSLVVCKGRQGHPLWSSKGGRLIPCDLQREAGSSRVICKGIARPSL